MNYYEILKVSKKATDAEIKSSYKALVKKYHPDLYVGDKEFAEKKIKEINEAYDILSDPEKKAEYDEYLNPPPEPTVSYTTKTTSANHHSGTTNTQQSSNTEPIWSLTNFIAERFNKLDKKLQLRIFIMILVFILALFLINLVQVKYYLTHSDHSTKNTSNRNSNTIENITTNEMTENFTDYDSDDFQELDSIFNNILTQYNETIYNSSADYFNYDTNTIF